MCEAIRIKKQISEQIQMMSEILNKFEQSLDPSIFKETQLRIKAELDQRKLIDGDKIRQILRILDQDSVSLQ